MKLCFLFCVFIGVNINESDSLSIPNDVSLYDYEVTTASRSSIVNDVISDSLEYQILLTPSIFYSVGCLFGRPFIECGSQEEPAIKLELFRSITFIVVLFTSIKKLDLKKCHPIT